MDESISYLLQFATPAHAARCTPSRQTWWRWRSGRIAPPLAVVNLLRILVAGELVQGGPDWSGWQFVKGNLYDPTGREHTPASIEAWWWVAQHLQGLRARENQRAATLPPAVVLHPSARPAHALTKQLYRRLEEV